MKLSDYIRGLRKGKDAHRLEKESMKDSFLADAMDGYTQVKGDHEEQIEKLRKGITTRSVSKKNTYAIIGSIAACLIIGIGISSYFLFLKSNITEEVMIPKNLVLSRSDIPTQPEKKQDTVPPSDAKQDSTSKRTKYPANQKKDVLAKTHQTAQPQSNPSVREATKEELETIAEAIEMRQSKQIVPVGQAVYNQEQAKARMQITQAVLPPNTIQGKVTDEKGEPLIGATIELKGTNIRTITDINGNFSVNKSQANNELTAHYIGYESVNIPIDTSKTMLIAMREDGRSLSEVVVVGFGSSRKSALTGSTTATPAKAKCHNPQPVIGKRKYKKYLEENLIRPTEGECANIKGEVTVTFVVDQKGNPQHIIVTKGLCESADKEAIRLIQEGPKWTTGILPVEIKIKFK